MLQRNFLILRLALIILIEAADLNDYGILGEKKHYYNLKSYLTPPPP
jgi:hypothetical protein